ncbi:hypothetical protein AAFF_G00049420 [Aldrovandia affinis]|uniref:Uncharacterized protein n=1 Tax=Aldrovandia affinis TaxID=143900 RepID=A0AAD7WEK7_9TELE|nr:hypothetical protein AAFF_G00049420 [Aldrovandia affinis]
MRNQGPLNPLEGKRALLNSWRVVWVVLSDDGVEFYKRKTDNSPKGMIPLKGAVLTSPCQDYGKKMLVFKVGTASKQAHYFQASHLEEREVWVKDIRRAITCLEMGMKFNRRSTRRSIRLPETVNLSELYGAMRDKDLGLQELTLEKDKKVFSQCFTGFMVVDWLVSAERARNRQEALMLATGLLNDGFLQPAGGASKMAAEGRTESTLLDQPEAIYYFADSGFYCEGSSSDEDGILKEEFRGIIVKQGYLLKQGHRRKNWKVRKFNLRDDPAYLHYYDPTKDEEEPLGSIHLRGSVITAVEYVPDALQRPEAAARSQQEAEMILPRQPGSGQESCLGAAIGSPPQGRGQGSRHKLATYESGSVCTRVTVDGLAGSAADIAFVSDKRVSRNHGLLEIEGGRLRIKSTHQNPCFFQPVVSTNTESTQSNSQALEEEEPAEDDPPVSTGPPAEPERSPELNGQSDTTLSLTQTQQAGSTPTCPGEEEEEEDEKNKTQPTASLEPDSPKPEQRKRVLPAWMMQATGDVSSPSTSTGDRKRGRGKATPTPTPTPAKQARLRKARNRTVSSEESDRSDVEQTPRKKARKIQSYEEEEMEAAQTGRPASNDGTGEESEEVELSAQKEEGERNGRPAPKVSSRRRGEPKPGVEKESRSQGSDGRASGQEVSSAAAEEGASGGPGPSLVKAEAPPRTPCPYGKDCYRKNPVHFQECSHPGDSDFVEGGDEQEKEDEEDDRPECPYGTGCYRKNPQHKKEYKHTQDPGRKGNDEEEDDDDDSFINDDSEDVDEDSDYDPPASDDSATARLDVKAMKKGVRASLRRRR